jgi:hypothetical protein
MSSNASSLSLVAASIQERVNTLHTERVTLQQLQGQLEIQKTLLESEKKRMTSVRKQYLMETQDRNEAELEMLETLQDCDKLTAETHGLVAVQTPSLQEKAESIRQIHVTSDHDLYATHLTDMLTNQRQMEEKLHHYNKKKLQKENLLNQLAMKTNQYLDDAEEMKKKTEQVCDATVKLDAFETKTNEDIASLSIQIRALLAKVRTDGDMYV